MTVSLSPVFQDAQLDSNGNPASGFKIGTFAAGTSTPLPTFRTMAGDVPHTNPIILNTRGEPPDPIWLTDGQLMDFQFTTPGDTFPPTSPVRTFRNIAGIGDTEATAQAVSQWIATGLTPTFVSSNSFSLAGNHPEYDVGRRVQAFVAGGARYGFITSNVFSANTTITLSLDSGSLDASLNRVDIGIISGTNASFLVRPPTMQSFLTAGTFTWTRPAGCKRVLAQLVGAGAAGSGASSSGSGLSAGAGGGAGEYARGLFNVEGVATAQVVIAAGGTPVTGAPGNPGVGNSTFHTFITAAPGLPGGAPSQTTGTALTSTGGPGQSVSGAEEHHAGQSGDHGITFAGLQAVSGKGGDSRMGTGGLSVVRGAPGGNNGLEGSGNGSGGSGAASFSSGALISLPGGPGRPGGLILMEFY